MTEPLKSKLKWFAIGAAGLLALLGALYLVSTRKAVTP